MPLLYENEDASPPLDEDPPGVSGAAQADIETSSAASVATRQKCDLTVFIIILPVY
jgi:hypothetical protein